MHLGEGCGVPLYTFRHTCLTRWAAHMDPYTLGYLAGHGDFSATRRYVHPQAQTVRDAMERAPNGQSGAQLAQSVTATSAHLNDVIRHPGLVEERFRWAVEARIKKPSLAWNGFDPVLSFPFGACGEK